MTSSSDLNLHEIFASPISVRTRICLSALMAVLVIVIYFFSVIYFQHQWINVTREILNDRINAMHIAQNVKQSFISHDNTLFRFLATGNQGELYESKQLRDLTLIEINRLRLISNSLVLHSRLRILQSESEEYFSQAEQLLKYWENNNLPQNAGLFQAIAWARDRKTQQKELSLLSAEGQTRLTKVFSLCDELVTLNRMELEKAQNEMDELIIKNRKTAAVSGSVGCGIIFVVAIGLIVSLLSPLNALLKGVRRVEKGDFNFEIPLLRSDELGQLTNAFNQMMRTIRNQHDRLLYETITDGLTGTYNQRHFRRLLKQELDRARRSSQDLCLLMIDIDHFKEYNDSQGHEMGNEVLKRVCQIIKAELREIDILARYGGDELAVILPYTKKDEAKAVAERLLQSISHCKFPGQEKISSHPLTISIGGVSFPENAKSSDDLVQRADESLYQAKHNGRACIYWPQDQYSLLENS